MRRWFLVVVATAFVMGPAVEFGSLRVTPSDVAVLVLVALLVAYVPSLDRDELGDHARTAWTPLFAVPLLFVALAVLFPLLGGLAYGQPLSHVAGEARWIQAAVVGLAAFVLYSGTPRRLEPDLRIALRVVVLLHLAFVGLQVLHQAGVYDTSPILHTWYRNQRTLGGSGVGYHIWRFSGAGATSSALGTAGVVGVIVFLRSVLDAGRDRTALACAAFVLLASGHRTSILAAVVVSGIVLGDELSPSELASIPSGRAARSIGTAVLGLALVYQFNVGRVRESGRWSGVVRFVREPGSLGPLAPRVEKWRLQHAVVADEYALPWIGTLSSPSHVLPRYVEPYELTVVDSYYVLSYLQGGIVLLTAFVLTLLVLAWVGARAWSRGGAGAVVALCVLLLLALGAITQNQLTAFYGKVLLALTVASLALARVDAPDEPTRAPPR